MKSLTKNSKANVPVLLFSFIAIVGVLNLRPYFEHLQILKVIEFKLLLDLIEFVMNIVFITHLSFHPSGSSDGCIQVYHLSGLKKSILKTEIDYMLDSIMCMLCASVIHCALALL